MLKTLTIAAALAAVAGSAWAADVTGTWLTPTDGGQVQIAPCGASVCGRLVTGARIRAEPGVKDARNKDAALRSRPLKGLLLLQGFTGSGGAWSGGTIYNPDDGNIYKASLKLVDADTLQVKGCVVAPLCKTQTWKRVK
jgi:uncharacterized protein (DUF2147 family)